MFILQLFTDTVTIIVSIIGAVSIAAAFVWNGSRKITTLENDAKAGKEQHLTDIKELKDRLNQIEKDNIQRLADTKIERRQEIAGALKENTDKFESQQSQLTSIRSDLKDVSTRVTTVNTKVENIEKNIEELKEADKCNTESRIREEHRIIDTITELRNNMLAMFTAFHGNKEKSN